MDSVGETLAKSGLHEKWIKGLRTEEINSFGHAALARLLKLTDLKPGATVLDAGCGTGTNTRWLADRGFGVTGADFSDFALEQARKASPELDYLKADLTALPFPSAGFDAIICIGVLMHIPAIGTALRELARVLKPGGWLIVAEVNPSAPETLLFRFLWSVSDHEMKRTEQGVEVWSETPSGPLMSRKTNGRWMTRFLAGRNLRLIRRMAGELTETYIYSGRLKPLLHRLNSFWFKLHGPAALAVSNYYLYRKG